MSITFLIIITPLMVIILFLVGALRFARALARWKRRMGFNNQQNPEGQQVVVEQNNIDIGSPEVIIGVDEAVIEPLIEANPYSARRTIVNFVRRRFKDIKEEPLDKYDIDLLENKYTKKIHRQLLNEMKALKHDTCSICISDYQINDVIIVLPICLHNYHKECALTWLEDHGTCPICRDGVKGQLLKEFHGNSLI